LNTTSSAIDLALAVEDDVDLVERVRNLLVLLRRDEDVHADFEPGGRVDDLVPASAVRESSRGRGDAEVLHRRDRIRA
jgi:hypothetical protein